MSIVEIGPHDWQEFKEIRLRALADAPDAFAMTLADALRNDPDEWRERLSGADPVIAVRHDDALVAMGGGWRPPDDRERMMVWGMWTAPEGRGRGHATSILTWLLTWAQKHHRTTVELHVSEGNDSARRLYERCGFEATAEWEPLREGSAVRIELLRRRS